MPDKLFKTTIVIWTDFDPADFEIDTLAREAMNGDAYCSQQTTDPITDKEQFPKTEFFDVP